MRCSALVSRPFRHLSLPREMLRRTCHSERSEESPALTTFTPVLRDASQTALGMTRRRTMSFRTALLCHSERSEESLALTTFTPVLRDASQTALGMTRRE